MIRAAQDYKTEDGKRFRRGDYALNDGQPSDWKLRLTNTPGGKPDPRIVGAAVAALGKGFRGQKVQLPAGKRAQVVGRVRRAWKQAHPGAKPDEMPGILKSRSAEAAADALGVGMMHTPAYEGVAPPGWEHSIKKMKKSGDVDNPFALAWHMHQQKMKPAKHEQDAAFAGTLAAAAQRMPGTPIPDICYAAARGEVWAQALLLRSAFGGPTIYQERPWR